MKVQKSTVFKAFIASILIFFTWLAETFSGVFSVRQAIRFGKGEENDVYEMDVWSWLTLAISALGAFFYVATMFFVGHSTKEPTIDLRINPNDNDEEEIIEKEEIIDKHDENDYVETDNSDTSMNLFNKPMVCHYLKEGGEFLVVAVPFSLLAYGSTLPFLKMVESKSGISNIAYPISAISGLADGIGNGLLHTHHFEAEESVVILFKNIKGCAKVWAIVFGTSVIVGHMAQGGLDGYAFLNTFPKRNLAAEFAISAGLGLAVTVCEGHTELRSTFWYENNKKNIPDHLLSNLILLLPSALHGLQPGLGPIIFLEMLYKSITDSALVNDLDLAGRLSLLAISLLFIGYPNALTFQRTVLPTTTMIVEKVKSFFNSRVSFFWCAGGAAEEKSLITTDNLGIAYGNIA
jgi:hypothetical protein